MVKENSLIKVNGHRVTVLEKHITNPLYHTEKRQVFIIGSKGIPAEYGGFETFVEKLTEYQVSNQLRYHVSCIAEDTIRYEYNGAKCFDVKVPSIGAAKAIYYDIAALWICINYCKARSSIKHPIFYVLACRIGPFISYFKKEIVRLGGTLYVNPDGHEWKRAKWPVLVRKYWKISEAGMVKHADLLICDSINIEKYIKTMYKKFQPNTIFIAYGSDTKMSRMADDDERFVSWLKEKDLIKNGYYLMVGRFVPENSFEVIIKEFMKSNSKRDLAIITTPNDTYLKKLETKLHFNKDKRIRFVGTVYNQELLKKIRENAYAYIHGHTVGGTNPSLLEALSSTDVNMLVDVGFNREVGLDAALYWNKDDGALAKLITRVETMSLEDINTMGVKAKKRITQAYRWEHIIHEYENVFLGLR